MSVYIRGCVHTLLVKKYHAYTFYSVAWGGQFAYRDLSDGPKNGLHLKSMVSNKVSVYNIISQWLMKISEGL
jgi:hypothetical protein